MNLNDKRNLLDRLLKRVQYARRPKVYWNGYWYSWNAKKGDYTRGFKEGNNVIVKTLTEDKKEAFQKFAELHGKGSSPVSDPFSLLSWSEKNDPFNLLSYAEKDKETPSEPEKKGEPAAKPEEKKPAKEEKEAPSPKKDEGDDALDAAYGSSKVWSSPNALVFSMENEDGKRLTAIPYEFASEDVVDQLYQNEGENDFTYFSDYDAFVKEGDLTQKDYDFLCKIGAIDKETHKFDDGRNQANIDEERHKYLRECDVLNADLPQFAKKEEPKPKEEPKSDEKPEPPQEGPQVPEEKPDAPMTTNHPTERKEPEPEPEPTEEEKKEEEYEDDVLSVGEVYDLVFDKDLDDEEEKKNLIRSWSGSYFDPDAPAQYGDEDGPTQKKYIEFFQSDSVPLETKMEALREFNDALQSRGFGNGVPASYISSLKKLTEGAEKGYISFPEIDDAIKTLDRFVDKPEPPEEPKKEPKSEPEPESEPQEEPQETETEEPYEHSTLFLAYGDIAGSEMNVTEKKRFIKNWADKFFPEGDDDLSNEFRQMFLDDDVPLYTKAGLLSNLAHGCGGFQSTIPAETMIVKTFTDLQPLLDDSVRNRLTKRLQNVRQSLAYSWEDLNSDNYRFRRGTEGWNGYNSPFTWLLTGNKAQRFQTREDAIKNFRGIISIPSVATPKERQEALDYIKYVGEVAALPTTTDFEATMLLSEVYWDAKNSQKGTGFVKEFKRNSKNSALQSALDEIASRSSDKVGEKPEWLTEDEAAKAKPATERRTLDLTKTTAKSSQDFLSCAEQARSEVMSEEEAQADREYVAKLTDACNEHASCGSPELLSEKSSAAMRTICDLYKKTFKLQSFKDYYYGKVLPEVLEREIKETNEKKASSGGSPLSEREKGFLKMCVGLPDLSNVGTLWSFDAKKTMSSRQINDFAQVLKDLNEGDGESYLRDEEKEFVRKFGEQLNELVKQKEESDQLLSKINKVRRVAMFHDGYKYDHLATCAFLKKAFPDRGGIPIFSQEWREEALNTIAAKDKKLREIAEQVFDVYDIIGRCFNTGSRTFIPPTVRVGSAGKGLLGRFCKEDNDLVVDTKKINSHDEFREVLAHELGHWLEHSLGNVIGTNADWLKERTGTLYLNNERQWRGQLAKTPHITVRPDGYGLKIYFDKFGDDVWATELVSTGMEYLVRCACMFATRSPEHFDLLIRNFEECANDDSKK